MTREVKALKIQTWRGFTINPIIILLIETLVTYALSSFPKGNEKRLLVRASCYKKILIAL